MASNITILFHTRIVGKTENELVPLYLRISINGKRIEQTTNRFVDRLKWSASTNRMIGASAEAKVLNNFLDALKNKVHQAEREMILDGKEITFQSFKDKWFGVDKEKYMLMEIFKQPNGEVAFKNMNYGLGFKIVDIFTLLQP